MNKERRFTGKDFVPSEKGTWAVQPEIEVFNIEQKDIYYAPNVPGHVEWVGLRQEKDGVLKLSFFEARGDPARLPTYSIFEKVKGVGMSA